MSAISGIWHRDGRAVEDKALSLLARYSRVAGPHGGGVARPLSELSLQSHLLHFDSHSEKERQPYVFGAGSVLTWDGRLDNRDDMLVALHHDLGADTSDSAIVAASYERWGEDCLAKLVGDWSLALWDAPRRAMLLARDTLGNRPLYYRNTNDGLAWATCLEALAAAFDLFTQPDHDYIAGRLTDCMPSGTTPFQTVKCLHAGHVLLVSRTGTSLRRHWSFQPRTIRYKDASAYDDHLRVLLTDAVRVRLRSNRTVWSHLSGGWDSSSLVCLATALIKCKAVEAPAVQPLSIVLNNDPESDESHYIGVVERWCGKSAVRVPFKGTPRFSDLLGRQQPWSTSSFVNDCLEAPMRAADDRVLLSGHLGDLIMLNGGFGRLGLLEPLLSGHPGHSLRLCWQRARHMRLPLHTVLFSAAGSAWTNVFRPSAPTRSRPTGVRVQPPAITSTAPSQRTLSDFPLLKREFVRVLQEMGNAPENTSPDSSPAVWRTFPFLHRPLLEFITAVPFLSLWEPQGYRSGMRRALAGVLPPDILTRETKGSPVVALARDRRERNAALIEDRTICEDPGTWQLVRRGYIDPKALAEALEALCQGKDGLGHLSFTDSWFELEAWLRTLDGHPRLTFAHPTQTTPPMSPDPAQGSQGLSSGGGHLLTRSLELTSEATPFSNSDS